MLGCACCSADGQVRGAQAVGGHGGGRHVHPSVQPQHHGENKVLRGAHGLHQVCTPPSTDSRKCSPDGSSTIAGRYEMTVSGSRPICDRSLKGRWSSPMGVRLCCAELQQFLNDDLYITSACDENHSSSASVSWCMFQCSVATQTRRASALLKWFECQGERHSLRRGTRLIGAFMPFAPGQSGRDLPLRSPQVYSGASGDAVHPVVL